MSSSVTVAEMLRLIEGTPTPRAVHMHPNYFEELKGRLDLEVPLGSNLGGLPVHINPEISTWVVEMNDGTFRSPQE